MALRLGQAARSLAGDSAPRRHVLFRVGYLRKEAR